MPLEAVKQLLFSRGLVLLLPLLVLAEEGLWRGLLLSALLELGMAPAWAITLSTLGFGLNHLAVAPLALAERGALALMALPLGWAAALLTARTRCLWGGVLFQSKASSLTSPMVRGCSISCRANRSPMLIRLGDPDRC